MGIFFVQISQFQIKTLLFNTQGKQFLLIIDTFGKLNFVVNFFQSLFFFFNFVFKFKGFIFDFEVSFFFQNFGIQIIKPSGSWGRCRVRGISGRNSNRLLRCQKPVIFSTFHSCKYIFLFTTCHTFIIKYKQKIFFHQIL